MEKITIDNFPIKLESARETVVEPNTKSIYTLFYLLANGFVIASFVDPTSLQSYIEYIKVNGFKLFPKNILTMLRANHENTTITDLRTNGKKPN